MKARHGAVIHMFKDVVMDILKLDGELRGLEFNPLTGQLKVYVEGNKEHFPPIQEACEAEDMIMELEVDKNREIIGTSLRSITTNKIYPHYKKEEKHGKEDNKEKEEANRDCQDREDSRVSKA